LCVSKSQNLRIMKELGVYGVSKRDAERLRQVRLGDDLFVYKSGSPRRVVAHCTVERSLFEAAPLDSYGYPFRIAVKFAWAGGKGEGVPLEWRVGENMTVEPNFSVCPLFRLTPEARSALLTEIYGKRRVG
jgi:hypothetical protein